jgi:MoaA/NifB/PqqE/SkfB family radical SAM enzyme
MDPVHAKRMAGEDQTVTSFVRKSLNYFRFGIDFFILERDRPHVLGLVANDSCNLDCVGCRVANMEHDVMSMAQVKAALEHYHDKGIRMLYISGGEPYLWRDGRYRLPDIVRLARDIGFLRTHVCTNGTARLSPEPDFTWISIDGFGKTFEKIRGIPVERVIRNVREFRGRHAIIFTINTINYREIRETLEFLGRELPRTPVMFFFHTPYYGIDHLYLSHEQREQAVSTLFECKRLGFPILNSKTALDTYLYRKESAPLDCAWMVDPSGEYRCCRVEGDPDICRDCGYSAGYEIWLARRGRPGAIRALLRMQ